MESAVVISRSGLTINGLQWCIIRHKGVNYDFLENSNIVLIFDADDRVLSEMTVEQVPKPVLQEFMLWRMSK